MKNKNEQKAGNGVPFSAFFVEPLEIRCFPEKTLTMKIPIDKIKIVYLTFFYLENGNVALFVS